MAKTITETKVVNYIIRDDAGVVALAKIGEAQEGAWTMHLGDGFLKGGTEPEDVSIGKGGDLADGDKHLEVSATVKDIRDETDRLTLTVELRGGKDPASFEISNQGEPGDNASYSIIVRFV
jgi:hypothetical protein